MSRYAIDFGTSNTVIARWNEASQSPEILDLGELSQTLGENPPLIPSLLYVQDAIAENLWIGQTVRDRGGDSGGDRRYFRSFKRGIGAQIQGFLPELDGRAITFEQVGSWFLNGILTALQQKEGQALESLVVTVPVDSFEAYRHWLGQVCHNWGVNQLQLIDEPTAAALGYGQTAGGTWLVVDFGGGTVDLSLVELNPQTAQPSGGLWLKWGQKVMNTPNPSQTKIARVLAKAGKNLGGTDIDQWIVQHFQNQYGVPANAIVTRLAERLKIELSRHPQAQEVYFNETTMEAYELTLDRPQLEAILQEKQFFSQLDELLNQVLQQGRRNGIERDRWAGVLLVGGTGQMPAVQQWLQSHFPPEKIQQSQPFTAIAQGALQLSQGFQVKDFLYHGYGIRYWNRRDNCHSWHPLIPINQTYPMEQPVELYLGASVEKQPSIELVIGELGAETGGTEIYFDGDRLVTRNLGPQQQSVQPLNDREGARTLAQLAPPGYPGSDRIKLLFRVDAQRQLRVTVEDLLTNTTLAENQVVAELR